MAGKGEATGEEGQGEETHFQLRHLLLRSPFFWRRVI